MQTGRILILSLLLTSGAAAGRIAAQAIEPGGLPDSTLQRLIAKQSRVRVQLGSGGKVELRQPRIEAGMLVGQVGADSRRAEYPIQDISQVWRRGSAAKLGFTIGAGAGFAGGAAMGIALVNLCVFSCPSPSASEQIGGAVAGGVLGGIAVGAVGALFGEVGVRRWKSAFKTKGLRATPIINSQRLGVSLSF